jgi:maltooligosyltrehalose trehalohydrolase
VSTPTAIRSRRGARIGGPDGPDPEALPLGAALHDDGRASFVVWAPLIDVLHVALPESGRVVPLERAPRGYHCAVVPEVTDGERYLLRLPDGRELPDPASRHQPGGVHGPSQVCAQGYDWQHDTWPAPDLRDLVIYELHTATFTDGGTFDSAIGKLPLLRELGVNAIELMPIAQFPGTRNWGYDGVFAFAAQDSYGGPRALKRLVDAAHGLGIAVILDVVYNHIGPEGNYLPVFGPYFTDTYHTPWGAAVNFDDAGSDEVRRYFIESALQWTDEFRIDGLRLDAIHAIHDRSAYPFLREVTSAVHRRAAENGRTVLVIGESDLGDPRILRSERLGGFGMDAQWLDDFHHSLRTLLTGEDTGYYRDFGTLDHLARAFQQGYVYAGDYSEYRGRRHGAPGPDILPRQFIVYSQNHDQVGNRMRGDRLATMVPPPQRRLAAAAVLLSPFTPMLFMGEEYGETRPFPYFVSHGDEQLVEAVRRGRREEFASFTWEGEPPDPQSSDTFRSAVLSWDVSSDEHATTHALYRRLLTLRRSSRAVRNGDSLSTEILTAAGQQTTGADDGNVLVVRRRAPDQSTILILNFAAVPAILTLADAAGEWSCALDTADAEFGGAGGTVPPTLHGPVIDLTASAHTAVLLLHEEV